MNNIGGSGRQAYVKPETYEELIDFVNKLPTGAKIKKFMPDPAKPSYSNEPESSEPKSSGKNSVRKFFKNYSAEKVYQKIFRNQIQTRNVIHLLLVEKFGTANMLQNINLSPTSKFEVYSKESLRKLIHKLEMSELRESPEVEKFSASITKNDLFS